MITLVVRRTIRATPQRLFEAWTDPAQLRLWWGPEEVECIDAQIDLRVDGQYRLANRFPDGRVVWITGRFERIEPPSLLVYTWRAEPAESAERVTVRFERDGQVTNVSVVHERIADERTRHGHEKGWIACLSRLEAFTLRGPFS
jgi:glutathione S-transferase